MDPKGEFPEEFRGDFRSLLKGMSSETIIPFMPQMLLKQTDCKRHPETFESTVARVPRSSRKSEAPGYCATGVSHRAPWAAASWGNPYLGAP